MPWTVICVHLRLSAAQDGLLRTFWLLHADAGSLRYLGPFDDFAANEFCHLRGVARERLGALCDQLLPHVGELHAAGHRVAQSGNHLARRACGCDHAVPRAGFEIRKPRFRDRRQLWRHAAALGARDGETADAPVTHVRQYDERVPEYDRYVAADDVGYRRYHAFIRYVKQVDTGLHFQELAREMRRASRAGRCVPQLARPGFGEDDELLQGFGRHRRMDRQHERRRGDHRDRREIAVQVEGDLAEHRLADGGGRGCREQRVTVRGGARRHFDADVAGRAGPVVDEELLSHHLGQLRGNQARGDIRSRARRKVHDDAHWLQWVGLRDARAREQRSRDDRNDVQQAQAFARAIVRRVL